MTPDRPRMIALTARQLVALTDGGHRPDKTVHASRHVIAALHAKGYLIRTGPESGRITAAGLAVLGLREQ